MVKRKNKNKVNYKNPLNLVWIIPATLFMVVFLLMRNFWLTLTEIWTVFRILLVKDDEYLRKDWNKKLDELKMRFNHFQLLTNKRDIIHAKRKSSGDFPNPKNL